MKKKLIIVADLGLLRTYCQTQSTRDRQPHLKLSAELMPVAANEKLSDQVPDQAGRFPRGGGAVGIPETCPPANSCTRSPKKSSDYSAIGGENKRIAGGRRSDSLPLCSQRADS